MKAEDWKPTELDRLSADAEGKAAGNPIPESLPKNKEQEAVLTWFAVAFGIAAILTVSTLALFNLRRYRKED